MSSVPRYVGCYGMAFVPRYVGCRGMAFVPRYVGCRGMAFVPHYVSCYGMTFVPRFVVDCFLRRSFSFEGFSPESFSLLDFLHLRHCSSDNSWDRSRDEPLRGRYHCRCCRFWSSH